jgi:hypothetical protein
MFIHGGSNVSIKEKSTEFVKADKDKAEWYLVPPDAMTEIVDVLTYGAKKYSPHNWSAGAEWSRYFSACMRHLWAWWGGEDKDPETGYSHLAHAACCILFLLAYEKRKLGDDNR